MEKSDGNDQLMTVAKLCYRALDVAKRPVLDGHALPYLQKWPENDRKIPHA